MRHGIKHKHADSSKLWHELGRTSCSDENNGTKRSIRDLHGARYCAVSLARPRTVRPLGVAAASAEVFPVTGGHGHAHGRPRRRAPLVAALGVIVAFMAAEVVIGLAAGSLALLSDAAHMLTDAGSLLLVLVTMRLAQ